MRAEGLLFLNKTRPVVSTNDKGEFKLVISALHRISAKQAELWRVSYVGQRAKDLWETCQAVLVPGQPIQIRAKDMRVYTNGVPVIEAEAESIAIAPRSHLMEGGAA